MKSFSIFNGLVSSLSQYVELLSQREVAILVGKTESTISKMLSSNREIFVCKRHNDEFFLIEIKDLSNV